MPFIHLITTEKISAAASAALKNGFGRAIELIPGKSETHLMTCLDGEHDMSFGGKAGKFACVEVKIYNHASKDSFQKVTSAITDLLGDVLGIPQDGVFVKYEECENWGWKGSNF